jgi:regulator of protease activity HflC (stomatin/prohibitin superfamily)
VDKAFGWIGEIFQTLLRLLPWLVIVPATHSGVAFVHGHRIKKWPPGLHWYWPVATSYRLMMIVRQTQKIQGKVVMTKDNKTVIVGAMVTYYVDDIVAAIAHIADLASDVIERAQGAILTEITRHTMEEIQTDRANFNAKLNEAVGSALNGYGVQVIQIQLTEFAPTKALTFNGNLAVGNYALWTGF